MNKPSKDEIDALVNALTGDTYGALITGSTSTGLQVIPNAQLAHPSAHKEQTRFRWLLRTHDDQLTALLKEPVVLAIFWDGGAPMASVNIIPDVIESKSTNAPNQPFESFTLDFSK